MALELGESQYLLVLAPALVVALMFLFFWLFMKETSYDEVLARQQRLLKPPPTKPDGRRKGEKKKSKKKESGGGGGGGGGGESEEELRDVDVAEATGSIADEEEAETVSAAPPPTAAPVQLEPPAGLRERKRKDRKAKAAAASAAPAVTEVTEVNGSKAVTKPEPLPLKEPNPPPAQTPPPPAAEPSGKKKAKKQKTEMLDDLPVEVKGDAAMAVKKEAVVAAESKPAQDGPAPTAPSLTHASAPTVATPPPASSGSGRKRSSKKQKTEAAAAVVEESLIQTSVSQTDSAPPPANHQSNQNSDAPVPAPTKHGKKQKNETDRGARMGSEGGLQELLAGLGSLVLSEADVQSVVTLLRDKSPAALDACCKSVAKSDRSLQQQQERHLATLQEEAAIAKDKVKQLSQELQVEKQKTGRTEAVLRDQRVAMEKEMNVMQAKAQGSYQDLQAMQMQFQQVREQLEGQIARLQQENGILRDAVSTATNQMETKQAAELSKLRAEYAGLMKELTESSTKLQQEELQRKSLEVGYKQNVSQLEAQLQDTKRRWEDLQSYLHSVNTEREKLQTAKQELQSQLLGVESEMSSKNKELQTLRSSLADTMLAKEQVEQKVLQLLEVSKHSLPDDALQTQVQELLSEKKALQVQNESLQAQVSSQATTVSHFEELQKLLAEKELQRKSLEDSLNAERSSGASRETNMQAMHNENMSLKAELHNLQAQISEQASSHVAVEQLQLSVQEKDEKIKTVEGLLEAGLIEMANKEGELKALQEEAGALRCHLETLQDQTSQQTPPGPAAEDLQKTIQEKDERIRLVEEELQAALERESSREGVVAALEQQVEAARVELEQKSGRADEPSPDIKAQMVELLAQLATKEQEVLALQQEVERSTAVAQQQTQPAGPSQETLMALTMKDKQLLELQADLAELRDSVDLHRKKNNELREKNWSAVEALSATETLLQRKLSTAMQENQMALEAAEAECRAVLHRLLPHVPLPTEQTHQLWLQSFERLLREAPAAECTDTTETSSAPKAEADAGMGLAEKLREAEEAQRVLQKDCETYKKVLAETEGILQRLQSSVEQEETRWREKLEQTESDLREMTLKVSAMEQELDRLSTEGDMDGLRREKQHLEAELERAEQQSATYVSEVRELKTQLTETLGRLEAEEVERQRVAAGLFKAQQALELVQEELCKEGQELIENSSLSTETEEVERKEKMAAGLTQTVLDLQQLLEAVNRQLTKSQHEAQGERDAPEV